MIGKNLHHHFLPHIHEDGNQHHPHLVSLFGLFVYLQIILVFGLGIFVIKLAAPAILGQASFGADAIISLTNAKRAQNGLPALNYSPELASAASAKASNMFAESYWAHNSPGGKTPWSFITAAGYHYLYAGENLARDFSDAGSVVDAWMNSPSHKDNLLDRNFKEIGVAVSYGSLTGREGTLVVQEFGSRVSSVPAAAPVAAASPAASPILAQSPVPVVKNSQKPPASAVPSVSPSATPFVIAQNPQQQQEPVNILASRKFAISRVVSMVLVALVFLVFALEVAVTVKREHLKLRSSVIAHLLILGFVLFALWYALGGAVI